MNCPYCNNNLPDGALACPACGASFVQQQPQIQYQQPQQEKTVSQIAAENELKKTEGSGILVPVMGIGVGAIAVLFSLIGHFNIIVFVIGIVFICLGSYSLYKRNARISSLKKISSGANASYLCPRCKSPNIQMNMVETGATTYQGTTRISENINPLHPFTHVNVRTGPTISNTTYGNKCHCLNCGNIFDKPEIIYR